MSAGGDRRDDADILRASIPLTRVSGGTHEPDPMPGHHLHHHLELNYVHSGWVTYSFLGKTRRVDAGAFTAFWAAVPHRLVDLERGSRMSWFTVPLPLVGSSRLASFLSRLFQGEVITDPAPGPRDALDVARWVSDLEGGSGPTTAAATLEILGRLIRLAATSSSVEPEPTDHRRRVGAMLDFIHKAYADPVGLAEVAESAALSPDYASATFHRAIGLTPTQYLLTIRVYRACQLLVETDRGVTDIALSSGFKAVSSFYDIFHRIMGVAPGELRKSAVWADRPLPESG